MKDKFESLNQFHRGKSSKSALDVGIYKNQIDWNNLPDSGIWKIIARDGDGIDDCIIRIYPNMGFHMIKAWENSAANGEWAEDWNVNNKTSLGNDEEFYGWLRKNGAFNMIRLSRIGETIPSYENLNLWDNN